MLNFHLSLSKACIIFNPTGKIFVVFWRQNFDTWIVEFIINNKAVEATSIGVVKQYLLYKTTTTIGRHNNGKNICCRAFLVRFGNGSTTLTAGYMGRKMKVGVSTCCCETDATRRTNRDRKPWNVSIESPILLLLACKVSSIWLWYRKSNRPTKEV